MRTRLLIGGVGVLMGAFGALRFLQLDLDDIVNAFLFLAGGVIVHDGFIAPLTVALVFLLTRVVPSRMRTAVTMGLVVLGTVTVTAIPVLGGFGARPDNLTVLPRNYVLGWFVFAALVLVVTGVAALRAAEEARRARAGLMVRTCSQACTIAGVSIEPDTKDWTWVIDQPCPECGWDPASVAREQLADLIHENTRGWYDVLADADFAVRPAPHVWSPLEYACHVRDVHAPVRRAGPADARRGRPDLRELGPGRHRGRAGLRPPGPGRRRDRAGRACRRGGGRLRLASRASSGSAPAGGATARCSRSRRSGATTCTTWSITSGTSASPRTGPPPRSRPRSRP